MYCTEGPHQAEKMIQEGDIIQNIELLRKEQNLTQADLASRSGINPKTYSRIKRKGNGLKVADLISIAATLNVSAEFILREKLEVGYKR